MAVMARSRDVKVLLEVLVSLYPGYLGLCVATIHNLWLNVSSSGCQDDLSGAPGALSAANCVVLLLPYLSIHTLPPMRVQS